MTNLQPVLAPNLLDLENLSHGFFTRKGGISRHPETGVPEDLDIGLFVDGNLEAAEENRSRIKAKLQADHLLSLKQIHSSDVVTVNSAEDWNFHQEADALVCATPGIAIGTITADCGPVLLCDSEAGVIGSAHAGWKGAVGGILENTIAAMEALGAKATNIHAALGPCIQQKSYEVGPEFYEQFRARDSASARFFIPSTKPDHHMFDLAGFIVNQLEKHGLASVVSTGQDTCSDAARFFSYRRGTISGKPEVGRHISSICLRAA